MPQPPKLALELARVDSVFEDFHAVDKDDRDVGSIPLAKVWIVVNVDL